MKLGNRIGALLGALGATIGLAHRSPRVARRADSEGFNSFRMLEGDDFTSNHYSGSGGHKAPQFDAGFRSHRRPGSKLSRRVERRMRGYFVRGGGL